MTQSTNTEIDVAWERSARKIFRFLSIVILCGIIGVVSMIMIRGVIEDIKRTSRPWETKIEICSTLNKLTPVQVSRDYVIVTREVFLCGTHVTTATNICNAVDVVTKPLSLESLGPQGCKSDCVCYVDISDFHADIEYQTNGTRTLTGLLPGQFNNQRITSMAEFRDFSRQWADRVNNLCIGLIHFECLAEQLIHML